MNRGSSIGKLWSKLNDMPMERKLLLVFLLLITLPLTFISYISYINYSHSIQENTIVYSKNSLGNMMDRVDDYIEDMVRISSIPAYQDDIKLNLIHSNRYHQQREKLSQGNNAGIFPSDFDQLLTIQRGIEGNISYINNIKRGSNSVYIFDQYGNGYYSTKAGGVRMNIKESYEMWKDKAMSSGGEALLFRTQKYTSSLNSVKYAFTVVRKIMDKSLQPIGLIAVDANISVIQDQIDNLDKVTHGTSVIIDESGNVIYDSGQKLLAANISGYPIVKHAVGKNGSFYDDVNGKQHLFTYITSPNTKWKVISSIPVKELTKNSAVIRNVTLLATFITVAVALLISIIFSIALTKPLRTMIRLMKSVQEGDFRVQFQVKHRDEIGQLGNQFNRMILRIDHLIRDIYHVETKRREAELHALQSQINPHFMYNTLESIRMAAEINDDTDVADMISLLGKLLRYSISDVNEEVTINREIKHVANYVDILNHRYAGRFVLGLRMPEELADYPMIKLVLQPIVENAIYHGMDETKPKMRIDLCGERTDRDVRITIKDDGTGIEESNLQRLNETLSGLRDSTPNRSGIGLRNVNERIKLHYGAAYGIKVESEYGIGTEVSLCLPLLTPEADGWRALSPGDGDNGRRDES